MTDAVLAITALEVRREARVIVHDVTLRVGAGELVALMGASGSGKTTILRAVAGLDTFTAGDIVVGETRLQPNGLPTREALRALHRRVGVVFQFHNLFSNLSALHNVWLAPVHVYRTDRAEAASHAKALLESLGVGDRADAFPHELSGGEAQRVAIARALAVDPPLLLMDEPTASLDAGRRSELAATLTSLVSQGRALVVATHDAEFARSCAQRVMLLDHGQIVKDGPARAIL